MKPARMPAGHGGLHQGIGVDLSRTTFSSPTSMPIIWAWSRTCPALIQGVFHSPSTIPSHQRSHHWEEMADGRSNERISESDILTCHQPPSRKEISRPPSPSLTLLKEVTRSKSPLLLSGIETPRIREVSLSLYEPSKKLLSPETIFLRASPRTFPSGPRETTR